MRCVSSVLRGQAPSAPMDPARRQHSAWRAVLPTCGSHRCGIFDAAVSWETVLMALSDGCVACPARAGAQRTDGSSPAAAQRMACRAARLCRVSRSMTLHEACRPWDFKWRWFDRGAVRGLRRFGRVQRGPVRPIDNGSENGLNAIFGGPDKAVTAAVRHTRAGVPTVSSRVATARTTDSRL